MAGVSIYHYAPDVVCSIHCFCVLLAECFPIFSGDFPGGRGTPPPLRVHAPALHPQFIFQFELSSVVSSVDAFIFAGDFSVRQPVPMG